MNPGPDPEAQRRHETLRELAVDYLRVSLANVIREFPAMPLFVAIQPESYRTHREQHPAFFGCFDWHSCVELHWVAIRLLKLFPGQVDGGTARRTLNAILTRENLLEEASFFEQPQHRGIERPYGWGWLLTLSHELETWEDEDGRRWAEAVRPLAELLAGRWLDWLPKLTYPVRTGIHSNTAFALSRTLPYARLRAVRGDPRLLAAVSSAAERFFLGDADYPARWEPSGSDFQSPALCEAELMSQVLPGDRFPAWLAGFLPDLAGEQPASLFTPVAVSDPSDGQIAHLMGLNLSRAACFTRLAGRLPETDARAAPMLRAAARHASVALPHVTGSDYMLEHWLVAYAVLLLSE